MALTTDSSQEGPTHLLTLGLIVLLLTLPSLAKSQQAPCGAFPAGSLSRMECERNAAKIRQQKEEEAKREADSTLGVDTSMEKYGGAIGDKALANECKLHYVREVGEQNRRLAERDAAERATQNAEWEQWRREHPTTTWDTTSFGNSTRTSCRSE
ncbi:MAG: hypothetical protein ABSD47_13030 [Candidatus Methylomirabilota bacterium]